MENYFNQVKEDIKTWMQDNDWKIDTEADIDEIAEELNDTLWIDDAVTGNGSGSYTFDREEAKENVLNDMETVAEALKEFCVPAEEIGERFLAEDWEYLDVTARCYVLNQAIWEVLEEEKNGGSENE